MPSATLLGQSVVSGLLVGGLYGLLAFGVAQRTGELGIRMALGAGRGEVVWMILREALLLVLAGVVLGVPVALAVARVAGSRISGLLFGTFVGIADGQVTALIVVAAVAIALVAVAGRPLLFASLDDEGAAAAGVPVRALGAGFLLLLGLAVAATAQITGTLLVFTLLVTPAATAQALTVRPGAGLVLAVAISLLVTWLGLGIAYFSPLPVGFWITSLSFGLYVLARAWRALRGGRR